ncbi:MAG: type VI secretion system-associated protein TagF [Pseudomonadota bacterium]
MNRIAYFGKLPARSDFVKSPHEQPLMAMLDEWLARVMSALPSNARWKIHYDALAPVSFAFVGPHSRHAIAGHIVASSDQSGRRFPFLMMRPVDVPDPGAFLAASPIAFAPLWGVCESAAQTLLGKIDPAPGLAALGEALPALDYGSQGALDAFLEAIVIGELDALLGQPAKPVILALGLLLQPLMRTGAADMDKSLVLPLPVSATARHLVAAFWLHLIAPFVAQLDVELLVFLTRSEGKPVLVVGFSGARAVTLQALIDPQLAQEQQVTFADTAWIDEPGDVDLRALDSYLDQPQLPLKLACELFVKTYVGE